MKKLVCTSLWVCLAATAFGEKSTMWTMQNGWLAYSRNDGVLLEAGEGHALALTIDDKAWPGAAVVPIVAEVEGGFDVTYTDESGQAIDRYRPFPALGKDAWLRTAVYENTSDHTQDLTQARLRIRSAATENTWHPRDFWMGARENDAVCVAYRGTSDAYRLTASGGDVEHRVDAGWRLAPGQRATMGAQGTWIGTAGTEAYRAEARRWFDAIDLHAPQLPDWLAEAILYETCAGGHVESRFSDVGGFDHLRRQVDYLADLGISTVWLQSVHTHKRSPNALAGWNLYGPLDYEHIDPILGGADALKRLTDAFQAKGLRVLGELVPHGGRSVQAEALPEGWTYNRKGEPAGNWGGLSMDYSAPGWQDAMRKASKRLARNFGIVGARIDVADGSGANWKSPRTNHASYSTLGGAVEMLQAIHAGFQAGGAEGVLLPESWNTMEFFRETPLGYGHALWFLFWQDIPRMVEQPERMVKTLRDFFELQRGAYPPGTRIIRTLGNHDTTVYSGRVQYRFGAGLSNALYGVCLMVPGVPMMYQEEEVGLYETRQRMNWSRRAIPEFAHGEVDYFAVRFDPRVFSVLRRTETGLAIGLANLSGNVIDGVVQVDPSVDLPGGTKVFDPLTGMDTTVGDHAFPWRLPPYGTSLIVINQKAFEALPPRISIPSNTGHTRIEEAPKPLPLGVEAGEEGLRLRADGFDCRITAGTGAWRVESLPGQRPVRLVRDGAEITFDGEAIRVTLPAQEKQPPVKVVIRGAETWHVSGRTALLGDRVLRRHFPFPKGANYQWDRTMAWGRIPAQYYRSVAPTGRLWESMLEPLSPENPAMAFQNETGNTLLLEAVATTARSIVLTEGDGDKPGALTLRFHAVDPDLAPRYAWHGWSPSQFEDDTAPAPRPQTVSFRIRVARHGEPVSTLLEAPRHPIDRNLPVLTLDGPEIRDEGDTIWFIQPGVATWLALDGPAGTHRIGLELRHSERSAEDTELTDAYTIEVNGTPVPFTWEKLNTYETGNAHFGRALTGPVVLKARDNTLTLRARHTWCAVRPNFSLSP